jgi:hypothetical protein
MIVCNGASLLWPETYLTILMFLPVWSDATAALFRLPLTAIVLAFQNLLKNL